MNKFTINPNTFSFDARTMLAIMGVLGLPINVLYRLQRTLCDLVWDYCHEPPTPQTHAKKRRRVEDQVRQWNRDGRQQKMCTGRPKTHSVQLKLPTYRDSLYKIQVNDLRDILSIDVERKVVRVEPMIRMDELADALLALGWTLPTLVEAEETTVGGLIMGGGIETSSHKTGFFHRICVSYELVVASGETLICSKEKNSDLFKAIPFSYGTLGILTAVELQIVEAKKFVRLEYHAAHTFDEALSLFMHHVNDSENNNFVEGFAFTRDRWVVMVGKLVNSAEPGKINEMGCWYKPWFYKHAETFLDTDFGGVDYIPIRDYYFRHSRSQFWFVSWAIPFGNHPIFRHLLGWTLTIDIRLVKLVTRNAVANQIVAQDLFVPPEAVSDVMAECERQTSIWPLWVVPVKLDRNEEPLWPSDKWTETGPTVMGIDIGLWGIPKNSEYGVAQLTNNIMSVVLKHHGLFRIKRAVFYGENEMVFQAFVYSEVYLPLDEFRKMLRLDHYHAMRKKYQAEDAFPDMYTKVAPKPIK